MSGSAHFWGHRTALDSSATEYNVRLDDEGGRGGGLPWGSLHSTLAAAPQDMMTVYESKAKHYTAAACGSREAHG